MLAAHLAPGDLVAGRYRLRVPDGAHAWQGFDERLERPVAIRPMAGAGVPEAVGLRHPNLVRIFDVAIHHRRRYLITELPDGGTLAERLQRGPVPAFEAGELACGVLGAVAYLHRSGLRLDRLEAADVRLCREGHPRLDGAALRRARLGGVSAASDLGKVGCLLDTVPVAGGRDPVWEYVVAGLKGRRMRSAEEALRQLRCPPSEAGQATEEFDALALA